MEKIWNFLHYNTASTNELSNITGLSPTICRILTNRGITSANVRQFLKGGMSFLHDPYLMKDMDKAVARTKKAIDGKEKITVYGDYDVDGISSVAMLVSYILSEGGICDYYIPARETEGYGLNKPALEKIAKSGTSLVITVDTGITACEEAEYAKKLGMDIIITDHHTVSDKIPEATAVLNPKRHDCLYPFKSLAGAGVAFKLLCALCGSTPKIVTDYCDMAAVATIADVVSLTDENRIIASLGLRKINKMPSVGLSRLLKVSSADSSPVTPYQLSFCIAPRLNAAGRMGDSKKAVELLLTKEPEYAESISEELDCENNRRKEIGDKILKDVYEEIEERNLSDNKVIVMARENWHQGVIGIIASKISELYNKNTILISTSGGIGKGSGRAVTGFNLYDALTAVKDYLIEYGGHALAAGLTIEDKNIRHFEKAINDYADSVICDDDLIPKINIDAAIEPDDSLAKLISELRLLEPYGSGNAKPLLAFINVRLVSSKVSKDGKHYFAKISKSGKALDCVAFNRSSLIHEFKNGDNVDIAGELCENTYGGCVSPQVFITDIRHSKN